MGRIALGVYLVLVIAVCSLLLVDGPNMRAAAEAEQARVIEDENKRICGKLGMPHGTAGFSECAGYLGDVRKHYGERLAGELAGLL